MSQSVGFAGQHNLPEESTALIGRDRDASELPALLREHRVVSLVGVGGVGKTRLALGIARGAVRDFPDGVWLVELASLADGALVPATVAAAVGVPLRRDRRPADSIAATLAAQRVLLVLDNCEHLVDACATLVDQLIRVCPRLHVLLTSREALRVSGEVIWPVAPLSLPEEAMADLQHVDSSDAVRLFLQRARAARPDFALSAANAAAVAQICRRLDGLPLALELAAARMNVLSPEQVSARLDDRFHLLVGGIRTAPARQQTLEATVAWSYDLLSPDDRQLFDRLAIFASSFSLAAAQAVSMLEFTDLVNALSHLVSQSLLIAGADDGGERRYSMLETLRAFARERLRARAEEAISQHRLTQWVRQRSEEAASALRGHQQAYWLAWAEREHDTIRSALAWSVDRGDAESALAIAGALWWSWLLHDRWIEGEDWLERTLGMSGSQSRGPLRARALHGAATTAALRGKYAFAQTRIDDSLAIAHELGDEELILAALSPQALLLQLRGEIEAAQERVGTTVELARRLGRPWYEARAAEFRASRALERGDLSSAAAHLTDGVRLARAAGDLWNLAMLLSHLGDVERMRGTHPRAAPLYEESIRLFQTLGLRPEPSWMHNMGYVALAGGQTAQAEATFLEALTAFRRVGDPRGVAECAIGIGCVRAAERRPAEAARLFGAGEAALAALGSKVWPSNRADYQHWARIAQAALGSDEWTAAWTNGELLGVEDALGARTTLAAAPPSALLRDLTRREREVAELAAQGLSNRRIAEVLVIAEKTAANHLQNALDKLGVHSRSQLAARAVELGLASAD